MASIQPRLLCHHIGGASKTTKAPGAIRTRRMARSGTPRPSLTAPLLLDLTLHCRCGRVLDLEPMVDAAGAIRRAEPLRHDALATESAGVFEDSRSIASEMLVEGYAVASIMEKAVADWRGVCPSRKAGLQRDD